MTTPGSQSGAGRHSPRHPLWDEMVLEPFGLRELPIALAVERRCFKDAWDEETYLEEVFPPHSIYRCFFLWHRPGGRDTGELPAGLCIFGDSGDLIHLINIGLRPEYRGTGLGKVLIALCLRYALLRGQPFVYLEVRVSNRDAIALYERCHFTKMFRLDGYYEDDGEDGWLMQLEMASPQEQQWAREFVAEHSLRGDEDRLLREADRRAE